MHITFSKYKKLKYENLLNKLWNEVIIDFIIKLFRFKNTIIKKE